MAATGHTIVRAAQRRQLVDLIVDLTHPALLPRDVRMLEMLAAKRHGYLQQGRGREAHAVGHCITMVWHSIVHPGRALPDSRVMPFRLDLVDTADERMR